MATDEATIAPGVPFTLEQALDHRWLTSALAPASGGSEVVAVEVVELLKTMATKVRFKATFADGSTGAFCTKGFLDMDAGLAKGDPSRIYEPDFYRFIAPRVATRTPACVSQIVDREEMQGVIVMRDLIVDGARFLTALDPYAVDQASRSLEQIALFHKEAHLLNELPWIARRVAGFAKGTYITAETIQGLLDGLRGEGLASHVRNADNLFTAMRTLGAVDEALPATIIHGDVHAGNIYEAPDGIGIIDWQVIQKGNWSLDAAYHINAVLAVDVAERDERRLLDHYLEVARGHGCDVPDRETAWAHYRRAVVYGYFLWAMTRRVQPVITETFVNRLGSAVQRHDSFRLLAV